MTNGAGNGQKKRKWLWMALAAIVILVALFVVPQLISVSHYKNQITKLISQSLGRPVRISSVDVRLLPWPGFVLYDLSVAEDPAYGFEPVLHANKVTASIRLLALFRDRIEISEISVDEASLNVVRSTPGHWNLDSLFRTAAAQGPASGARRVAPLPYFEATDSRINFKNGVEKLPFSLVSADVSLFQENPGEWRIRLRGQPARTDVSLDEEETGVVRMEASMGRAPALRQMPLHLDLDWREAQLGQLARLITGSDPGWRGDLTGEIHLDGTADAAQITTRLRAAGVHRAEFAPVAPLDFDAKCSLLYHYTQRSFENLACDSPLGDGRVHVTGEKPAQQAPRLTAELDRIPVTAGLDALRTLRSGLMPDLEAKGTVSGKIAYAEIAPDAATANAAPKAGPAKTVKPGSNHAANGAPEKTGPLTGSLVVTGLVLSGAGLSRPVQTPKITLEPVALDSARHGVSGADTTSRQATHEALSGTVPVPAGGALPLTFSLRFSLTGYQIGVRGQVSIPRARELARAAGIPETSALDALAGDPLAVDLIAQGPWLPAEQIPVVNEGADETESSSTEGSAKPAPNGTGNKKDSIAAEKPANANPDVDSLFGTVTLHNANWKADYLASHVAIDDATLHLESGDLRWDPVDFSYGPVKGTASVIMPSSCPAQTQPGPCRAQFQMHFDDLDAAALQTALLGAKEKGTLLSNLIDRFHASKSPPWPQLEGDIDADAIDLGLVTLEQATIALRLSPTGAELTSFDAEILGGNVHATGTLVKPQTDQDKPDYSFDAQFEKLNATDVGALLGLRWQGAELNVEGKIELSGYADKELASSAKGDLQFEVRRGAIGNLPSDSSDAAPVPVALERFDRWTGDATIANGAIELGQNQVANGSRKRAVAATITFGDPPAISFGPPKTSAGAGKSDKAPKANASVP
jgi:hypothetical protein